MAHTKKKNQKKLDEGQYNAMGGQHRGNQPIKKGGRGNNGKRKAK